MLRDVFYYGAKPNAHPRERFAENLEHARSLATTDHFWIINEYCDYRNFDWDFDFDFLPDDQVWTENHNNVWPSQHQKDSGTWLCPTEYSEYTVYRCDVEPVTRFNVKTEQWVELDLIDHSKFDFSWHPDPSDPPYIYKWGCKFFPAQFKHVLEYHVPGAVQEKYMDTTVELLPELDRWVEYQQIDKTCFDMSWRPDPMDPPFIYVWGNKYVDAKLQPTLEYHAPGATNKKYMPELLRVLPEWDKWTEVQAVDKVQAEKEGFDFSWRPDPREPAYIYTWGNKYIDAELLPTLEYHCEGATERKYMTNDVPVLPEWDKWTEVQAVDKSEFDFSWRPDPREPAFIYTWGNKYIDAELLPTLEYHCDGATERKYMTNDVPVLPEHDKWVEVQKVDKNGFDFSWRPDPREPAYIYTWGNKYIDAEFRPTLEYHCKGATERKYMSNDVPVLPEWDKWVEVHAIDKSTFDFSWRPDPREPDLIYVFGNQLFDAVKMPTLEYHMKGATERKYMEGSTAKLLPNPNLFEHLEDSVLPNYAWLPDPDSPPYIYVWGNQWNAAEDKASVQFVVPGATEYKYMSERAIRKPCMDNWIIPAGVDCTGFDFSWEPSPHAPPYIYEFGTQWQKTGGPQYVVPGATEKTYVDFQKVKRVAVDSNWHVPDNIDPKGFDFTWHPDATAPAYDYVFATQWAFSGGPIYKMDGATGVKYVDDQTATAIANMDNWAFDPELIDVDTFDWSWHPYVEDQPYIYEFGTQWQKTGGPKYITPGADSSSPVKYIDTRVLRATRLPHKDAKWHTLNDYKIKKFDYSWHPDSTEDPYIYVFGNNLYPAEEMPTIQYRVPGATEIKYVNDAVAELDVDMNNWVVPENVDVKGFNFSWKPNPNDPPYIYEFGTQHQKTGGPRYVVPGATEHKYLDFQTVTILPNYTNWKCDIYVDKTSFDFSWHPDATDPPYIYAWGNQWVKAEDSPAIEYHVEGATEYRYMEGTINRLPCFDNWQIPDDVNPNGFDFSWQPSPKEEPYIYQFGTQWQKTGGPRYVVKGATEVKYVDFQITPKMPDKDRFTVIDDVVIADFDYSWHPDDTEEPYIYVFGNNQYPAEEMPTIEYRVDGATSVKYVHDVVATLAVDMRYWDIPVDVDVTGFDFSWRPNPNNPPYIYEFGTQWQKTGGPTFKVEGATEKQYVDTQKVTRLPSNEGWQIPDNIDPSGFDFSWHPDATSPPYVYVFATQWAFSGGPVYAVPGATEIKYVDDQIAKAIHNMDNWAFDADLIDVDSFDWSWHPYVDDQPYIYEFGTQWQKTGGPKYITPGADSSSPTKYIDTRILKAKRLPHKDAKWHTVNDYRIKSFDYSWHPDNTEEPFIYVFGNTQYPAEEMPTIEYRVPGATKIKYVSDIVATLEADLRNWEIPEYVDTQGFDFSWKPNPNEPPYIYEFGTQWQKTGGPRYVVKGATEVKYVDTQVVKKTSVDQNWEVPSYIDATSFDFTWHPDATSPAYNYVFPTQWAFSGGPVYKVEGATEIKYVEDQTAKALPNRDNWEFDPTVIDETSIDFSWHPYVDDQPYIYEFGTQWQKTGGARYITPGATPDSPIKYVDTRIIRTNRLPCKDNWNTLVEYEIADFDYSWHPDNTEQPYVHVFGNTQYPAEEMPTIEYRVPGATEIKYEHATVAKLAPSKVNWEIPSDIDSSMFDFSWIPHPEDPPFIYQFGTQWQKTGGPRYVVPDATNVKYVDTRIQHAIKKPNKNNFKILHGYVIQDFDYSWHPDETAPAYIYQFGNNWHPVEEGPTLEYRVPGATAVSLVNEPVATLGIDMTNWEIPEGIDVKAFDFTWLPHPATPPYVYQFGTLQDPYDGPIYHTPNNTGEVVRLPRVEREITEEEPVEFIVNQYYIETTLEDLVNQHPDEIFWAIRKNIDYTTFDFDWRPDLDQAQYVHVFGSSTSIKTQTYFVNAPLYNRGFTELSFVDDQGIDVQEIDIFYVDRGNPEALARFEILKSKLGNRIQKTRYLNSWVDTINRCTNRATSDLIWVLNSELDYSSFDFTYYPNPWQMKMVHVFGTQHSHWGTTFMVNRETFPEDTKYIKIIEHLSNLNFVKEIKATATQCVHDIVVIDHGNRELTKVLDQLQKKAPNKNVTTVKYNTSYFNTLKDIINKQQEKKEHYIWICSSVCDYSNFDLSYICDPFAKDQLHVFPSDTQKFGDTFFIDVNKTREIISEMQALEDYHKVNYNGSLRATRLPEPVIVTTDDTHVDAIKLVDGFPYVTLITSDNADVDAGQVEPMNLWAPDTKNILVTSTGATRIVVPAEAKDYVNNELYDYPYIKRAPKLAKSKPLDIVFLSNGEIGADENYEHLLNVTKGLPNRVVRVDGIDGRVAAYHAAAEASNTPWMFTVFAKLKVSPKFDWNWQPDRMQAPKHYIFHAKNPVNGLTYGHQAMIAYNKKLTLANEGRGLDFTLDDLHETVPLISGTAQYNTDPFSTWRTAFREVLKLRSDHSDTAKDRLNAWLNNAEGDFAQFSIKGAVDADEYYDEVDGDFNALKLSYEWAWLRQRFDDL